MMPGGDPQPSEPQVWAVLRDSLFRPKKFFLSLNPQGPWPRALLFTAALSFLSALGLSLNDLWFPAASLPWFEPWPWHWNLLEWPFILALELLALRWFHAVLRWRGGASFPYRATFRAYCYSAGPNIFCLLPLVGVWIAALWGLGLSFYAIKSVHRSTRAKVIAAFLISHSLLALFLFAMVFAAGYFRHYFA